MVDVGKADIQSMEADPFATCRFLMESLGGYGLVLPERLFLAWKADLHYLSPA